MERRVHIGRGLSDRSLSPVKNRHSPRRRSPHRRERSPTRRRSPPPRTRSPQKARSPKHVRARSPVRSSSSRSPSPRTKRLRQVQAERGSEKVSGGEHGKNNREVRDKGRQREIRENGRASSSRSPSPHTKRLMRAQAERETEKVAEGEHGRNSSREERYKGRHGEHGEARDNLSERRLARDKSDGGSSRSSRRGQPVSPEERNHRSRHGSRSRSPSRASRVGVRDEVTKPTTAEQSMDGDIDSIARMKAAEESLEAKEKDKEKPSFELSGKLAEETNRVRGVTLLFNEPADARKPDIRWRLYVFKAGEVINEPLYVHRQSCYLFGRERRVADIPTDHPSCSKQHAIIQYRLVEKEQPNGLLSKKVRPYLMDLGSTNGTFINDNRIEPQRYYELFEKDTIRFGNSSREYVILHENSMG